MQKELINAMGLLIWVILKVFVFLILLNNTLKMRIALYNLISTLKNKPSISYRVFHQDKTIN